MTVDADHYKCPYCTYTGETERMVRVHIKLGKDGEHKAREGFSPITHVEAVDDEGNVIDEFDGSDVKRELDSFDPSCDPGNELDQMERRIVATKMMNLEFSAEEVTEYLQEKGEDVRDYQVANTLRDAFGTTRMARGTHSFDDLTDRQQKAVDALARWKLGEFETQREAAESIGESQGYLGSCQNRHESVVEERYKALQEESSEETVERENGTGSYTGPEKGIDATAQYITERPHTTSSSEDTATGGKDDGTEGSKSKSDEDRDAYKGQTRSDDVNLDVAQAQLDLLHRLVVDDQLSVDAAFDEAKGILADVAEA